MSAPEWFIDNVPLDPGRLDLDAIQRTLDLPISDSRLEPPMPDAHEAAVEAIAGALCGPDRNQWRGAYGSIPPDPDAWHYETDGTCSYDTKKAAAIALAALVRSEAVRAALVEPMFEALVEYSSRQKRYAPDDLCPLLIGAIFAALRPAEPEEAT